MHGKEIIAPEGLVAQGPDDHGRMILVSLHHGIAAVDYVGTPFRSACGNVVLMQFLLSILPGTMCLQIRLVNHIEAVFIAQLIPNRLVRVMGSPYSIDVMGFHELNIADHIFFGQGAAGVAGEFMAVGAFQHNPFAVDFHQTVFDLKRAETNLAADSFLQLILIVHDRDEQGI
ncbi:hypothetical protein D3C80_1377530 [compost metagenome]